jgi:hypothetical protein
MKKIYLFISILIMISFQVYPQVHLDWLNRFNPQIQGGNWGSAKELHMVVDDEGSVYICGPTQNYTTGSDIIIIKYNSQGDSIWGNRYDSSTPEYFLNDKPLAMAIDKNKNVIIAGNLEVVTGSTHGEGLVIKFGTDGDTLWTRRYKENLSDYNFFRDVVLDDNNNIYVTGLRCKTTADYEAVTIKYDEGGNQIWMSKYDYMNMLETADEICMAPGQEFCYVTAHSGTTQGSYLRVIKYNCQSGDTVWTKVCPTNGYGRLCTDHDGNILVATTVGQAYPYKGDIMLLKYAPNSDLSWFQTFSGSEFGSDDVRDLKVDENNNIYVAGVSFLYTTPYTEGDPNWTTIKYDPAGNVKWVRLYDRPGSIWYDSDLPCGIEIDNSGNVLVAGQALESSTLGYDYILLKYDGQTGETLDTYFYYNISGTGIGINDFANAMVMDNSGNIFITGTLWSEATSRLDFATMKLSPLENTYTGTYESGSLNNAIGDLQTTSDTIIVNSGLDSRAEYNVTAVKVLIDSVYHTNDSDLEFSLEHQGITATLVSGAGADGDNFMQTSIDEASPLMIENGIVPFTGTYYPNSALTVFNNLDPDGEWIFKVYDNNAGNTGIFFGWKLQLQISQVAGIGPNDDDGNISGYISLGQNCPNPFHQSTKIGYKVLSSQGGQFVTLKVFDFLGREVETLVNEEKPAGNYEVEFNPESGYRNLAPGIYFYTLKTADFPGNGEGVAVQSRKMIYLR